MCMLLFRCMMGWFSTLCFSTEHRSTVIRIFYAIYGDFAVKVTARAHCPRREQKSECLITAACHLPKNTVHSAPRPLGQLESTFISWYVMIGCGYYKSNARGELPYEVFLADQRATRRIPYNTSRFPHLVRRPTHFNKTYIF